MLVAVLSDIHDRASNLSRILSRLEAAKPDALICCGDLTKPDIIDQLAFSNLPLHICLGNCDHAHAPSLLRQARLRHASLAQGSGTLETPDGRVGFVHAPEPAREMALSGQYTAVFFGHTHRARMESVELITGQKTLLANPGDVQGRYEDPRALLWNSATHQASWVL